MTPVQFDTDGGACLLSDGGPRSAGWRDHTGPGESRRRKFDFDFRDSDGHGGSGGRRRAGSEGLEDDRDGLPEWCTDEEDGEMGTFDSSGAFMTMKVGFFVYVHHLVSKNIFTLFFFFFNAKRSQKPATSCILQSALFTICSISSNFYNFSRSSWVRRVGRIQSWRRSLSSRASRRTKRRSAMLTWT